MYERKRRYHLPRTVDEAADLLAGDLRAMHQDAMGHMTDEQFERLYAAVGAYIIDDFKIWEGNNDLLRSCLSLSADDEKPFDPARIILRKVRQDLQEPSRMVIIK